jgi:hypothetical protein
MGGLKPDLSQVRLAVAGDMGDGWTNRHIANWVVRRKGKFSESVDESVTHLLCTPEEFQNRTERGGYAPSTKPSPISTPRRLDHNRVTDPDPYAQSDRPSSLARHVRS